jgi:hypothetical protein
MLKKAVDRCKSAANEVPQWTAISVFVNFEISLYPCQRGPHLRTPGPVVIRTLIPTRSDLLLWLTIALLAHTMTSTQWMLPTRNWLCFSTRIDSVINTLNWVGKYFLLDLQWVVEGGNLSPETLFETAFWWDLLWQWELYGHKYVVLQCPSLFYTQFKL